MVLSRTRFFITLNIAGCSGCIFLSNVVRLNEETQELLGIDARLDEFSDAIAPFIKEILDDYGLKLAKFSIAAIDIDDNEIRKKYDEIGMDAISKIRNAQADKSVFGILGDDWTRQQSVNILSDLANNPGAGGVAAAGAGLGMGFAAGGAFGEMAHQVFVPKQPAPQVPSEHIPAKSGAQTENSASNDNPVQKIKQLKEMLELEIITNEEFEAKKQEILKRM